MTRAFLLTSALLSMAVAAPATAETLNFQGIIAPYCNVNLTNVPSGTASVVMVGTQQIANLRLSCNASSGTKLITAVQNGDLLSSANSRINYGLEQRSPSDALFNIAESDTSPMGALSFTRQRPGYSQPIANGIPLKLHMNLNVAVDPNQAPAAIRTC